MVIVASKNTHKVSELQKILSVDLSALPTEIELPEETADSFEGNALIKARAVAAALRVPVIADDSGICADALGGAPGVRSARFAAENASDRQNLELLQKQVPVGSRLHYVCVLAYVDIENDLSETFRGTCSGVMAEQAIGDNGFGYDPIFIADQFAPLTMAQISAAEKNSISHRKEAAQRLAKWLKS